MTSLYWDDFARRVKETVNCVITGKEVPVRRVAVFITDRCNFSCSYCNNKNCDEGKTLSKGQFLDILDRYGDTALIHITGGEPSVVPWLYPLLNEYKDRYRFNLNTNAFIEPPYGAVKRLKVSLDHHKETAWDVLVGRQGAFKRVVENIKKSIPRTVVSVTYTMTRENYKNIPNFIRFTNREFPDIYAVFFSVYKGTNPKYKFTDEDAQIFFWEILPQMVELLNEESYGLLRETLDEKRRIIEGVRFPENNDGKPCYLSMSERVISPSGEQQFCSHLYRDKIRQNGNMKDVNCTYGCNRRLVAFNEEVESEVQRLKFFNTHLGVSWG